MNKTKFTLLDHMGVLIILFLLLSAVFPMLTMIGKNIVLCLAAQVCWLALASYERHSKFMGIFRKWIWWLAFLAYLLAVPIAFHNRIIANRYTPYYIAVIGVMMFEYYYYSNKMEVVGRAVKIAVPFYLFTLIKTIYASMQNPWIVRAIKTSQTETHGAMRQGVGNYSFIYLSVVIFALACVYFFFSKRLRDRVIAAVIMCLTFILGVVANYTTAMMGCVIVAVVAAIIYVIDSLRKGEGAKIFEVFMFTILMVLVVLGRNVIVSLISGLIQEESRIGNLAYGGGDTSFFESVYEEFTVDRLETWRKNFDLLKEHPILGQVPLGVGVTSDLGQHSSILDTFSLWGLVVGVLFIKMIGLPYKHYEIYKGKAAYRKPIYCALIIIALFNNLTFGILLTSTIICPYFIYRLCEKNTNQKEREEIYVKEDIL